MNDPSDTKKITCHYCHQTITRGWEEKHLEACHEAPKEKEPQDWHDDDIGPQGSGGIGDNDISL